MDIIEVLLEVGNVMEFGTYTGHPTSKSVIFDMLLGSIASIKEVPSFTNPRLLTVIKYIDVIWFDKDDIPEYCFEVETSTKVREGLLRLYQVAKSGIEKTRFSIIAPKKVYSKFKRKIMESPFVELKDRFWFRSVENLVTFHEICLRYCEERSRFLGKGITTEKITI